MSSNVPGQELKQEAPTAASAAASSSAPASAAARPPAATDDTLACQWERCSEKCPSAEALFVSFDLCFVLHFLLPLLRSNSNITVSEGQIH